MGMYTQQAAPPAYQQASQSQQSLQDLLNAAGQNLKNMQNRMVNAALDPSIVGQQLQNANAYGLAFNSLDYNAVQASAVVSVNPMTELARLRLIKAIEQLPARVVARISKMSFRAEPPAFVIEYTGPAGVLILTDMLDEFPTAAHISRIILGVS